MSASRRRSLPPSARSRLQNAALIAAGAGAALLLVLGGVLAWKGYAHRALDRGDLARVREKLDRNPQSIFRYDPDLSYMLKPGFEGPRYRRPGALHRTNSRSLLGAEEVDASPGIANVLFLGDSVTYGEGVPVEETFVSLLQGGMPRGTRLWNGSSPAWSTSQEARYYGKYLSDVPWRRVVLVFTPNDLVTYELVGRAGDDDISIDNIRSWDFVRWAPHLAAVRARLLADPRTAPLNVATDYLLVSWVEAAWEEYLRETLAPFVERLGPVPLTVVAIPSLPQVLLAARTAIPPGVAFYPERRMAGFCSGRGIPFVDTAPALVEALRRGGAPYLEDGFHLSPEGHRVVAGVLAGVPAAGR